jgi:glycosyltransferase involved in cell wall biosynthesis
MIRIAFTVFGGDGWTGGTNYLRNLISALVEMPVQTVEPVLFVAPNTPPEALLELTLFLRQPPVVVPAWAADGRSRVRRLWHSSVLQNDILSAEAFARENIDLVFVHMAWYGLRFALPTIGWIADFQHRHLPGMFSLANRVKRNLGYAALSRAADVVLLSSCDAERDALRFLPHARGKTAVLPFSVRVDAAAWSTDTRPVLAHHGLPDKFFYLPNQLWRHKNHLLVIEALRLLKARGTNVVVVASGNPRDVRNPEHPALLLATVASYGLTQEFRFLGMVPYEHIMPLMRASQGVINPSLFEGWSTTVEEAKALGVPLLLSDLAVHREQTRDYPATLFDPQSVAELADLLATSWGDRSTPQALAPPLADQRRLRSRMLFGEGFQVIAQRAIQQACLRRQRSD